MNSLEENKNQKSWAFKISSFFESPIFIIVFLFLVLWYFYSLLFGERSISALISAESKKQELIDEYNKLQEANQKLQKKYFELIQLTPEVDAF